QLNAVTAIAGSGPGYVFHFANALAQAGTTLGLESDTAQELARLTLVGAGTMLETPGADPTALEDSIATPGGVTEAALQSLDAAGFDQLVVDAVKANVARAERLRAAKPASVSAACAALWPAIPWAPAPGGVAPEQRYIPGAPNQYGSMAARGRNTNWVKAFEPVAISRPI